MTARSQRPLLKCAAIGCALLAGCAQMGAPRESPSADAASAAEQLYQQGDFAHAAQAFMDLAAEHSGDRNHYRLRAAEALREEGDLAGAANALDGVKSRRMSDDEAVRLNLLEAEIALSRRDPAHALQQLNFGDAALPLNLRVRALELRARAQADTGDALGSARSRATLDRWLGGNDRAQNEAQIVELLRQLNPDALKQQALALAPGDPLQRWLNQALRRSGQALPQVVMRPNRPVGTLLPEAGGTPQREGYRPVHVVALLLPSEGGLKAVAQPLRDGFFAAYFADKNSQRPELRVYNSGSTPQDAVAAYQRAVAEGADHVVGPLARESVAAVFAQGRLPVPVLALNHPESGETPPPGSAEFGLLPDVEAAQAAEHLLERGLLRAVVVAASDDWAERAALAFRAQFESGGGQVISEARIRDGEVNFSTLLRQTLAGVPATKSAPALPGAAPSPEATNLPETAIFISMRPQQARLLLPQVRLAGYSNLPVFATSHVYAGASNPGLDRDLDGVEFCDAPWLFDAALGLPRRSDLDARGLESTRGVGARLFALGLDAYALLPYLEWLAQHHDQYLAGATGQLAEDNLGRVQRLLIWAQFDNGLAHPVSGELQMSSAPQ